MTVNPLEIDGLDFHGLESYLSKTLEGFTTLNHFEKFSGGQSNPTFLLETNVGKLVVRSQPPGELLPSAHAVDREFRVIQALMASDVPVPEVLHLCEDPAITGKSFYVMRFLRGRHYWNPALPELNKHDRSEIYQAMTNTLAALHTIDVEQVGLTSFGRSGDYFARQVKRWVKQYRQSETEKEHNMEALIDWLEANILDDDGNSSLIHGDFRLDNLFFHMQRNEVIGVLDWELSTIGHPFSDLAYQCMQLRMPPDGAPAGLGLMSRKDLGIPEEQAMKDSYCAARNLSGIDHWRHWLVLSFFRFAAILQGVKKRAIDGNAASDQAQSYGAMVPVLARMAAQLLEQDSI